MIRNSGGGWRVAIALIAAVLTRCTIVCMARPHHVRETPSIPDNAFAKASFEAPLPVFVIGKGPPILLLHELPGLTKHCLQLAQNLSAAGYTVYVPLMFGDKGVREGSLSLAKRCASKDFYCTKNELSPIKDKLLAIGDAIHALHPGQKMGVIGMCLTGNLPLAFADGKHCYLGAAILSQPALPLAVGGLKDEIGLSAEQITAVQSSHVPLLAMSFTKDCISPPPRLAALTQTFKGQIETLPVPSHNSRDHAILTDSSDHADDAFAAVTRFLELHVKKGPRPCDA